MNIRKTLASLFANYGLSIAEYRELPEAKELIARPGTVKALAEFDLPEVTKLICGVESLRNEEWADKYKSVCLLYWNPSTENIRSILSENDNEMIVSSIIPYAGKDILDKIISLENSLKKDRATFIEEYGKIEKSLIKYTEKEKELSAKLQEANSALLQVTDEDKNSPEYKKFSNLKGQLTKCQNKITEASGKKNGLERKYNPGEKLLEKCEEIFSETRRIKATFDADVSIRREEAYKVELGLSKQEELLKAIINGDELEEYADDLKEEDFCKAFLDELYDYSSEGYTRILARLYDLGLIDIFEEPFYSALKEHFSDVISYADQTKGSDDDDAWNDFIWEYIFESDMLENYSSELQPFMNSLDSVEKWEKGIDLMNEQFPDKEYTLLGYLFLNSFGKSRKILKKMLEDAMFNDQPTIAVRDFTSALLRCNDKGDHLQIEYTDQLISRLESELHKAKKKVRMAERDVAGLDSQIFSAIYQPVNDLELLATNIRTNRASSSEIPYYMVVNHLTDNVAQLREGLDSIGLHPVSDIIDWKNQKSITFDPVLHTYSGEKPSGKVKLRSMGFVYQDENGDDQIFPASVITESVERKTTESPKRINNTEKRAFNSKENLGKKSKSSKRRNDKNSGEKKY